VVDAVIGDGAGGYVVIGHSHGVCGGGMAKVVNQVRSVAQQRPELASGPGIWGAVSAVVQGGYVPGRRNSRRRSGCRPAADAG